MLRINNLNMPLEAALDDIKKTAAERLGCSADRLQGFHISKKSVDARNKRNVHFVYSADCEPDCQVIIGKDTEVIAPEKPLVYNIKDDGTRPIVVGSGPAGMFAAMALAEAGLKPIIIERGDNIDKRKQSVNNFWQKGLLNPESNVQFGEGGAGTFSDGKLVSGIKKDRFTAKVIAELFAAGAPQEILYMAKPHIGTDNLQKIVRNIRRKIENMGGEYRFNSRLCDLVIKDETLKAIKIQTGDKTYELPATKLFLAIGHSARDTFEMLYRRGLNICQKPFSVGARIEHRQELIDHSQYGAAAGHPALGAADYKLAVHLTGGRSVYTFCMCPGGKVVAAASESGRLVTNGMSEFARSENNANAALLVGVDARDFQSDEPLAGMYFQRRLEEAAFNFGGKNYQAPAQLVGDFLKQRPSKNFGDVEPSYRPGVAMTDLSALFPQEISTAMRAGIKEMAKKLHGFDSFEAVLTGVETRSSSPIRIIRDNISMQSNIRGIYPCGEGAGYAGGITSSAADALKVVHTLSAE